MVPNLSLPDETWIVWNGLWSFHSTLANFTDFGNYTQKVLTKKLFWERNCYFKWGKVEIDIKWSINNRICAERIGIIVGFWKSNYFDQSYFIFRKENFTWTIGICSWTFSFSANHTEIRWMELLLRIREKVISTCQHCTHKSMRRWQLRPSWLLQLWHLLCLA